MTNKPVDIESQILEVAKKIFVLKGYDYTTMGEIAKEVGISRTAMHYYFRTKEILFEAILQPLIDTLLPNIGLILDQPGSLLDKLPELIDQYANMVRNNPFMPLFLVTEMNRDSGHLQYIIRKDLQKIEPILRLRQQIIREMEAGLLQKRPIIDVVTAFISLLIFPYLVRRPLIEILLNDQPEEFDRFYQRRKEMTYQVMMGLLKPDSE